MTTTTPPPADPRNEKSKNLGGRVFSFIIAISVLLTIIVFVVSRYHTKPAKFDPEPMQRIPLGISFAGGKITYWADSGIQDLKFTSGFFTPDSFYVVIQGDTLIYKKYLGKVPIKQRFDTPCNRLVTRQ